MMKNRIYRKYLAVFLLFCFAAVLTACGKEKKEPEVPVDGIVAELVAPEPAGSPPAANISRSEFVGLLGEEFGYLEYEASDDYFDDVSSTDANYAQIQACAEWDVIAAGGNFRPDDRITLEEAIDAAVRAVQIGDIRRAGYDIDENKIPEFFVSNIAKIDISNLKSELDAQAADGIMRYAALFRNGLEFPQITEMTLKEEVKTAGSDIELNYDGMTGRMLTEGAYSVGDIVYWDATDTTMAKGIRIKSIDGTSFQYEEADVDDVFSELRISGTFDGKIMSVVSASENTRAEYDRIYNDVNSYGVAFRDGGWYVCDLANSGVETTKTANSVTFHAYASDKYTSTDANGNKTSGDANMDLIVAVKNIKVTVDYDHEAFNVFKPKLLDAKVNFDTEIKSEFTGRISKTIALGEMDVNVWGPLFVRISLAANVGADGELTITYQTKNMLVAGWQKGKGLYKDFKSDSSFTYQGEVTLTAEATALADVRVGWGSVSKSLINAEVTSGAVAIAKGNGDLLSGEWCVDVLGYVPLRWGLNQRACLITDINSSWKYKTTVWDSSNSPFKLHFHFEDGGRTEGDICTRGAGQEVVQEEVDENGDPFAELEFFEFDPMKLEFIELTNSLVFLRAGEADSIGVVSLPEGYTTADLVYVVEKPAVCSVDGGRIVAVGEGSTIVTIKTGDGAYTVLFSVTVFPDLTIEDFVPII